MCCCFSRECCFNYWAGCVVPTCDFRGVCGFPHGVCYSIMGILLAIGGVMMNMYVIMSCFYQRIKLINPATGEQIPGSERGYGFLSREVDYGGIPDYKQCIYYPHEEYDDIFDGWMKAGKGFAYMSGVLGIVAFMVLFLTCCMAFSPVMFERWLLWGYIVAAIFIGLSFLIFGSQFCGDNHCEVAQGGGWAISTFLFWLCCANSVKSFAHARPKGGYDSPRGIDNYDDVDDDYDDLYYENEADKYPLPEQLREFERQRRAQEEADKKEADRLAGVNNQNEDDDYSYYEEEEEVLEGEEKETDYDEFGQPRFVNDPQYRGDDANRYDDDQFGDGHHRDSHFDDGRQHDPQYGGQDPYYSDPYYNGRDSQYDGQDPYNQEGYYDSQDPYQQDAHYDDQQDPQYDGHYQQQDGTYYDEHDDRPHQDQQYDQGDYDTDYHDGNHHQDDNYQPVDSPMEEDSQRREYAGRQLYRAPGRVGDPDGPSIT